MIVLAARWRVNEQYEFVVTSAIRFNDFNLSHPRDRRMNSSTFIIATILFANTVSHAAEPIIRTIAGTGLEAIGPTQEPLQTNIGNPFGVETTPNGELLICEVSNHRIWKLDLKDNTLSVIAGTGRKGHSPDGRLATESDLNEPYEVRVGRRGDIFFVEMQNHIVRRIDSRTGKLTTIAGNGKQGFSGDGGPATSAMLHRPHSIALAGNLLYIADIGNHRIRRVDLETNTIETFAGNANRNLPRHGSRVDGNSVLGPRALFVNDRTLWVALREGHSVWRIDLDNPTWHHVAGTGSKGFSGDGGPASKATFNGPKGIAVANTKVYVVDTENQAIRAIDLSTETIETIAGVGPKGRGFRGESQQATEAFLNRPHGVCVDADGNVYIGDSENHRVRIVSTAKQR